MAPRLRSEPPCPTGSKGTMEGGGEGTAASREAPCFWLALPIMDQRPIITELDVAARWRCFDPNCLKKPHAGLSALLLSLLAGSAGVPHMCLRREMKHAHALVLFSFFCARDYGRLLFHAPKLVGDWPKKKIVQAFQKMASPLNKIPSNLCGRGRQKENI